MAINPNREKILEEEYAGFNVEWRWLEEVMPLSGRKEIKVSEWVEEATQQYTDASQLQVAAAAATEDSAYYLGEHATIMDAELMGITIALEEGHTKIA